MITTIDLATLRARLTATGYATGEARASSGGVKVMTASDPDGYRIEFIERGQRR